MLRPWLLVNNRALRRPLRRADSKGAMLILTMMLLGLIWFSMLAFSSTTLYALRHSSNYLGSERATTAAEAGLVYAMAKLENNPNWQPQDSIYKLKHLEDHFHLELLDAREAPTDIPSDALWIRSRGVARTGQTRMAVAVVRMGQSSGGAFDYGLFGETVRASGGVFVSAYDSRSGWQISGAGDIGTNSVKRGSVRLNSGVSVDGTVWAGEGGNLEDSGYYGRTWGTQNVVWKNWSVFTRGEKHLGGEVDLPPVEIPKGSRKDKSVRVNWRGAKLEPGSYKSLRASGGGVVKLSGGTYVFDSLQLSGSASLVVSGNEPVVVYVRKKLQTSGGTVSNSSRNPRNLAFVMGERAKVSITGGSQLYGVIYGPKADIKMSGGTRVYGSCVGKNISMSGGSCFYYDVALKDQPPAIPGLKGGGGSGALSLLSWRKY